MLVARDVNGQIIPQEQRMTTLIHTAHDKAIVVRLDACLKEILKYTSLDWVISNETKHLKFSGIEPFVAKPLMAEDITMIKALTKCKECCESDVKQKTLNSLLPASRMENQFQNCKI
ncbi:RNase H domain-containing protein [Raphanus sativus]|nr:RNase H domain-containing protein [Raphanus sativus]